MLYIGEESKRRPNTKGIVRKRGKSSQWSTDQSGRYRGFGDKREGEGRLSQRALLMLTAGGVREGGNSQSRETREKATAITQVGTPSGIFYFPECLE